MNHSLLTAMSVSSDMNEYYDCFSPNEIYEQNNSPAHAALRKGIAEADGGQDAALFSSGMAARIMSVLSHTEAGDHIIASKMLYPDSMRFFNGELKRYGIDISFTDFEKDDVARLVRKNTKLVYAETIASPIMKVSDIKNIAEFAHRFNAKLIVDNTFATPALIKPLNFGADIVVYNAEKFISNQGDIAGGIVVGDRKSIEMIESKGKIYGMPLSRFDAWMLLRSLKSLELRMHRHSENAKQLAEFLSRNSKIKKVHYPGNDVSERGMFYKERYGGMLSIEPDCSIERGREFVKSLDGIMKISGYTNMRTTISYPYSSMSREHSEYELADEGISETLSVISAGLEDAESLINEFDKALKNL